MVTARRRGSMYIFLSSAAIVFIKAPRGWQGLGLYSEHAEKEFRPAILKG